MIALFVLKADIQAAFKIKSQGNYSFFPNVSSFEELGRYVCSIGLIDIPQHLIDAGYINFKQIGIDFNANGVTFISGIGAIQELSLTDIVY